MILKATLLAIAANLAFLVLAGLAATDVAGTMMLVAFEALAEVAESLAS